MSLFPIIQPEFQPVSADLPLYKEVAWDFTAGRPIFKGGAPVFVTGVDAVKVWAYKALLTPRTLYDIYTWGFGCEVESLIGQDFIADTKRAEATRYVREALEINPYITKVSDVTVLFEDDRLTVNATISTVYGEVSVFVRGQNAGSD